MPQQPPPRQHGRLTSAYRVVLATTPDDHLRHLISACPPGSTLEVVVDTSPVWKRPLFVVPDLARVLNDGVDVHIVGSPRNVDDWVTAVHRTHQAMPAEPATDGRRLRVVPS